VTLRLHTSFSKPKQKALETATQPAFQVQLSEKSAGKSARATAVFIEL